MNRNINKINTQKKQKINTQVNRCEEQIDK